ncbi:transposase [Streptomyces olivoreticuli]
MPLAQPGTAGTRYRHWRTVAFDGCSPLKVPDGERNRGWLGKLHARFGTAGYTSLMLMGLVETGTRGLLGAVFGPSAVKETAYAMRLVPLLGTDMLLLADRGFDGNDLLRAVTATGAQVLLRCKSSRRPAVLALLPDGSYLTRIAGLRLRVVEAQVKTTGTDGSTVTGHYRLLTTLTDHRTDPATALVRLYHERWEIEVSFLALRHTLLNGRVLRSKDPAGIEQEMWALLVLYQALRLVMVTAVETVPGTDPDRAGFTCALEAARNTLTTATGIFPTATARGTDLVEHIGTAVLTALLPARRARFSSRTVKCGISRYHTWNRDGRPLASTAVTTVEVTVHRPFLPTDAPQLTTPALPPPGLGGRWPLVAQIMAKDPARGWRTRDIARPLGITAPKPLRSLATQMGKWALSGLLTRTARGAYTLTLPANLTLTATP